MSPDHIEEVVIELKYTHVYNTDFMCKLLLFLKSQKSIKVKQKKNRIKIIKDFKDSKRQIY